MLFGHKNVNKLMKKYFSHKLKFLIWGTNTKRFHIVSCNAVQIEQSILKLKEGDFDGYILSFTTKKNPRALAIDKFKEIVYQFQNKPP